MNVTNCMLLFGIQKLLNIYLALLVIYALVSWLPGLRGRWTDYLSMAIEPVLLPLRRIIPPLGNIDLSFIVLMLILQAVAGAVVPRTCYLI